MDRQSKSKVERFSVSLEPELIEKLEYYIKKNRHPNRSEAIRFLIKRAFVEDEWVDNKGEVVGIIALVYDHHRRGLVDKLIEIQHHKSSGVKILATLHTHLDHDNCLETISVSGLPADVRNFYSNLKSVKGLKHISLTPATCGSHLA